MPHVSRGLIRANIPFPDHRTLARDRYFKAVVPEMIPRFPRQVGYIYALKAGLIPQGIQDEFSDTRVEFHLDTSKAFKRLHPRSLFPTVRTDGRADDVRMPVPLHWDEPRILTVMEARRAQSIPDHEVLIGNASHQWLVIGNGVDRKASVAMGISLRDAIFSRQTQETITARLSAYDEPSIPETNQYNEMPDSIKIQNTLDGIRRSCSFGIPDSEDNKSERSDTARSGDILVGPTTLTINSRVQWKMIAGGHAAALAMRESNEDTLG